MPRIATASGGKPSPRWHRVFLAMLPKIVSYAKTAFRNLDPEARQECRAERRRE